MSKSSTSIDALNTHLFEAIEMLKNNSDVNASANEKIDINTAKQIADIGKVIIDGYKVKAQVLGIISHSENPLITENKMKQIGLIAE